MRIGKAICLAVSSLLLVGSLACPVGAMEVETVPPEQQLVIPVNPRSTGYFQMTVPGKTNMRMNESFSLPAGDSITIRASYTPADADLDFGLVDSDGVFHYVTGPSGSVNKTIQVRESGNYTLLIRNNSSSEVYVSGHVSY